MNGGAVIGADVATQSGSRRLVSRRLSDGDPVDERLERVKVGKAKIFHLESEGAVPIELFGEQVQAKTGDGDIVRRKR
jgi:hypothetical protein